MRGLGNRCSIQLSYGDCLSLIFSHVRGGVNDEQSSSGISEFRNSRIPEFQNSRRAEIPERADWELQNFSCSAVVAAKLAAKRPAHGSCSGTREPALGG